MRACWCTIIVTLLLAAAAAAARTNADSIMKQRTVPNDVHLPNGYVRLMISGIGPEGLHASPPYYVSYTPQRHIKYVVSLPSPHAAAKKRPAIFSSAESLTAKHKVKKQRRSRRGLVRRRSMHYKH
ncbi:Hypothetical predicted protein [Cloeon dipterum]|uniref:Secreted protein n=1 Tax=Cloeon dipterum TaxID=197152 RepID=A0A8S1D2X4_9INSE|nr:Hypothetical predicted protein [Cloeon dipterum]